MKKSTKYIIVAGLFTAALFIPFVREFFWFNMNLMLKAAAWSTI